MAAPAFLQDFARMPNQRKVLVFVVIAFLLGALYWQFFYKSLVADLEGAEAGNNQRRGTDAQLAADIPRFEELKKKVKDLEEIIAKNQTALPTRAEVPAFFETIERKITESGVELQRWRRLNEENVDGFIRVPVEVEMVGTYMQIKRFFASLVQKGVMPTGGAQQGDAPQERERIVSVEGMSLTNPFVKNSELRMTARFVAVTFRQDDKNAKAEDAKPESAPAQQKSDKPAPPTNTPAGAKAATEKAIEKGDAVNRNAAGVDEAKTPAAGSALKGGI
jgi:Tfp pilus assembly protein PilO